MMEHQQINTLLCDLRKGQANMQHQLHQTQQWQQQAGQTLNEMQQHLIQL
jgi:hypothetical protein